MEKFVIVIGRQYGAGGRSFGKKLAKKLNVSYYDKELLSKAAEELGFDQNIFNKNDERKPSFLRSLLSFSYGSTNGISSDGTLSQENIYRFQSETIKSIARKESCVIVGRTADYLLRNDNNLISIFIHAPIEKRARTIMERDNLDSINEAISKALKHDRIRENYYNFFTNRKWGEASNYNISFDSSKMPEEIMIQLIENIIIYKQ